jgi:DNA (cytosine-5)-methyltransferase 1
LEKTFAEFFAGIGLVRLGLEQAGWKAKFANDIDQKKFEMYWENFTDTAEFYKIADIRDIEAADVPRVTLATASFPCTDLSLAGYRRGLAGSESGTFWPFANLLGQMDGNRPRILLIENVTGFLTSNKGSDFEAAIRALNDLGYACDPFILDAIHFVPQSRPRLFVVARLGADATSDVPAALSRRHPRLVRRQLTDFLLDHQNLRWCLSHIPAPPPPKRDFSKLLERLPAQSERWWPKERVDYLLGQMSPRHTKLVQHLREGRRTSYVTVYRRVRHKRSMAEVRADGIAGCLRTPRGGSSRQILLVLGRGKAKARFMTPTEYAALMGARDYKITVPDNQAYFGFGDAVCVPAVKWVAEKALNLAET